MLKRAAALLLILTTLLIGCGNVKFSSNSGKSAGTEEQAEQPADVAGGLGLTCVESDNINDINKSDFVCSFRDSSGKKFVERPNISLVVVIKIGSELLEVNFQPAEADSNFKFTVAKSAISQVIIDAKFTNPQAGGSVLVDKSTELKPIIADKIAPKNPMIQINNGAEATTSSTVNLTFSASNSPTQMYVTNIQDCSSGGTWENYATGKAGWKIAQEQLNENAVVSVKFKDAAGNETSCVSDSIIHDDVSPTVTISSSMPSNVKLSSVQLNIIFSEPVNDFSVSDIKISGGTLLDFSGSEDTYFVTLKPSAVGQVTTDIPADAARDQAGNLSNAAVQLKTVFSINQTSGLPDCNEGDVSGGDSVMKINGFKIHKFIANGSSNLVLNRPCKMEILVVAGGGGGGKGGDGAGGGGAGGLIYQEEYDFEQSGTYPVIVGRGGSAGSNGENSSLATLISIGGGRGADRDTPKQGGTGGSGGGAAHSDVCPDGQGTPGQGYKGGCARRGNYGAGGGGGGAGGPGINGSGSGRAKGGNGGPGLQFDISGSSEYFAGGGGANGPNGAGVGGKGGGGNGGIVSGKGTPGKPNTGGGGGSDQSGGSGIVIIRYPVITAVFQ